MDFDDAIQVSTLCGGRYQRKPDRYKFLYRPGTRQDDGAWHLDVHWCDIEDVADGRLTDLTLYCCTSPNCGAKFSKPDGHCNCDYVEDSDFGTFQFPNAMEKLRQRGVADMTDLSTWDDVVVALGLPDVSGGGITDSVLGYIRPWITYRRPDCQLRFEFDERNRVRNVTILEKDWEPGR